MSDSKIEWTDKVWNPVRGCTKISPGCKNCYAETFAERWRGVKGHPYEQGFDLRLVPEKLEAPLAWKKPARVFVNSMSDLFHEDVPFEFIDKVFAVMLIASEPRWRCGIKDHDCLNDHRECAASRSDPKEAYGPHTFQVLTKRPDRMAAYFARDRYPWCGIEEQVEAMGYGDMLEVADLEGDYLKNVWLGTSVENQEQARKRIPFLLETPAAVRWISAEPLLGPLNLLPVVWLWPHRTGDGSKALDWVVVGGESGPSARPCSVDWIDDVVRQCHEASTPVFVKQLGRRIETDNVNRWDFPSALYISSSAKAAAHAEVRLRDPKGGDQSEWPEELRVREFPLSKVPA